MKTLKGVASGAFSPIIGKIVRESCPIYDRKNSILVTHHINYSAIGYKGCITSGGKANCFFPDHIYDANDIEYLNEGDIVQIDSKGNIRVLWEVSSTQNSFMLTEACNCKCIMCPQPPRPHDKTLLRDANLIRQFLKQQPVNQICITGGEPTLLGKDFITFLENCINEHPTAQIDILTNGKTFKSRDFTKKIAQIATNNVCFCVSLHSEVDILHDYIVSSKGSFIDTQQGIYNLAEFGCRIEIRHVINRLNASHLTSFAEHIYNYFPFCSHYAFMGMELYGNAEVNILSVNISPHEYKDELCSAVLYLHRRGLPVSIYNIPLCLCAPQARYFARKSISTWKNKYIDKCQDCILQKECSGFFATSVYLSIDNIHPIKEES